MLTLLFLISVLWIVWKIVLLGLKMAWGITKFTLGLIVFPAVVIGLFFTGLVYLAVPILVVAGLMTLAGGTASA